MEVWSILTNTPNTLERWLTLVTLASAALAGLLYLGRQSWRLFHLLDRIAHEVTSNGGSSMKDDVTAVALAVGSLQRDFAELRRSKDTEHRALQIQLDGLAHELNRPTGSEATHRKEGLQ